MKRPLFPCVTGLVLGEAAAISFGFKGGAFPALLFLLTGICFLVWRKRQGCFFMYILLVSVFALAGFLLFMEAQANKEPLPGETLPMHGTIRGRIAFLNVDEEGEYDITLEKAQFLSGYIGKEKNNLQQDSSLKGKGNAGEAAWKQIRGKCRVFHLKEDGIVLWPGDWICCQGDLTALSVPTNPGEFNSEVYYQSRGISCQFFADSGWREARERFFLARIACRIKRRMDAVYAQTLGGDHAALLDAMVLGDKSALSEEQKQRYEENGVAHLLSVSGLHVSILAGSWFRFLRKRKIGYAPACAGGLVLLLFYGCMTGFGNSIVRAVIMYAVYLGAEYFGACYDMASSMSLAGLLMLLESPWRLQEGGCQLAFAAIFAICCVQPRVKELAQKRRGEKDGRIYRLPRLRKKFGDALLSSTVISAVTLPIVLRVFFTFSPYSVFINLLVIPCMTPMMVSAIVAGIAGSLFLSAGGTGGLEVFSGGFADTAGAVLGNILILPAEMVLTFFDFFLEHMRQLPGAVWMPGCPSLPEMAGLYLLEGFLLYIWYRRRWKTGLRAALLFGLWCLAAPSGRRLQITMLDVGQGDSILLQMPGGESVLIDGGSTSRSGVGQYVITPALQYYGIAEIDYVVATHMDADHIFGIGELLEAGYPVGHLLLPGGQETDDLIAFAGRAEKAGAEVVYFQRGDRIRFPDGAGLECLHPFDSFETEDKNAASLVFHLEYGEFDALFTGDLEASGEKALCQFFDGKGKAGKWPQSGEQNGADDAGKSGAGENTGDEKKSDGTAMPEETIWEVLKVAHHGSKYSTGDAFLERVSPQAALISAGKNNRYGHPHKETLERLEGCGAKILMTAESGAIFVETDGERWEIRTFCGGR